MDIEDLKRVTEMSLQFGVNALHQHGGLTPMFLVFTPSGIGVFTFEDGDQANDPAAKDELAAVVRRRVQEGNATAVAMLSDIWVGEMKEGDPGYALAASGQYSSAELERMGLLKRREAIAVILETPIYRQRISQFYRRSRTGNIVLEERQSTDSTDPSMGPSSGRFFGFFPEMNKDASA